jgi:PAS domain S-box-containing protein
MLNTDTKWCIFILCGRPVRTTLIGAEDRNGREMTKEILSGSDQHRSALFELRSGLCFALLAVLVFHHQHVSPQLWFLGSAYLASNLVIRILPAHLIQPPAVGFGILLLDIAGLTIVLYSVSGLGSESLLLFYLTVLMATLGEGVSKSVGIAFGASALYVWIRMRQGQGFLEDSGALLRIPLFLMTALLCGYLAQELRRHKRQVQSLKDIQRTLAIGIESSSKQLARSEDLRVAAQELARRFRDLIQDLNAIVWEMDVPSFRVAFVSQQAEQVLGYPLQSWLEEKDFWVNHIYADDRERIVDLCRKAISEATDYNLEYRALTADGRVVWLQDVVHVVCDASGKVRQLRGVIVDITQRKQLEEQFLQAQKMEAVGRLAGGVAHDFNNLLTVILGYCELGSESLGADEPLLENIKEIRKAGERAAGLTRRLLAFSRQQTLAPQVIDLNTLVANMERLLRRLIGEDIELVAVQRPGLGTVKADPGQIEQVIMNLAVNARDAMPQGGKLIIETSNVELDQAYASSHVTVKLGPHVMLAISDTGTGIDAKVLSQIFEPFFTTKESGKGTGLGLATVYGIVKQSGGNIWVYSEPGRGTTFKIYLPRLEEIAVTPPPLVTRIPLAQGSETILIVEDDDEVRALVRGILQARGYKVLDANRPSEAIATSRRHEGPIHMLLTDVVMPEMSGRELADHFKHFRGEAKVLYMSGYPGDAIVHFGVLDPDTPFLQKPFTTDGVARKVREVLDAVPGRKE